MPSLSINDAGTWRRVRRVYVNDAGTWRAIRGIYVNDSGTWRRVYAAIEDMTLVSDVFVSPGTPPFFLDGATIYGYVIDIPMGSVSPSSQIGGTVAYLSRNLLAVPGSYDQFVIRGLTSDPGQGLFSGITIAGVTQLSASATYLWNSSTGEATWTWSTAWPFTTGTYAVTFT